MGSLFSGSARRNEWPGRGPGGAQTRVGARPPLHDGSCQSQTETVGSGNTARRLDGWGWGWGWGRDLVGLPFSQRGTVYVTLLHGGCTHGRWTVRGRAGAGAQERRRAGRRSAFWLDKYQVLSTTARPRPAGLGAPTRPGSSRRRGPRGWPPQLGSAAAWASQRYARQARGGLRLGHTAPAPIPAWLRAGTGLQLPVSTLCTRPAGQDGHAGPARCAWRRRAPPNVRTSTGARVCLCLCLQPAGGTGAVPSWRTVVR